MVDNNTTTTMQMDVTAMAQHLALAIGLLFWTLVSCVPVLLRSIPGVFYRISTFFNSRGRRGQETSPLLGSSTTTTGTFVANGETAMVDEDNEWEVANSDKQLGGASAFGRLLTFMIAAGAASSFSRTVAAVVVALLKTSNGDDVAMSSIIVGSSLLHATIATLAVLVGTLDPINLGGPRSGPVAAERAKRRTVQLLFATVTYFVALSVSAYMMPNVGTAMPGLAALCMLAAVSLGLVNSSVALGQLQRKTDADGLIPSPEVEASLLSRLTLLWMNPLMTLGFVGKIEGKDIWNTEKSLTTEALLADFHAAEAAYKAKHPNGPKPSLVFLLWTLHWRSLTGLFFVSSLAALLSFTTPYFLSEILKATPLTGQASSTAFFFVFGLFVFDCLNNLAMSAEHQIEVRIGMKNRNLLSALIYEKSLRRALVAQKPKKASDTEADGKDEAAEDDEDEQAASMGKIVNLMSADATRIGEWIGYIYTPALMGLRIVLCCIALVYLLGWSAIGGVTVMTALMFSGGPLANSINNGYTEQTDATDRRITAINEVLQGIKIIKFFAWERRFYNKIDELREKEISIRWRVAMLNALNRILWYSAPSMTALTTLGFYTAVMNKPLTAEIAFTALSLFNVLKVPLERFPDTIVQLLDAMVSVRRIESYLNESDMEAQALPRDTIGFSGASFVWHKPEDDEAKKSKKAKGTWKNLWGLLGKKEEQGTESDAATDEQPAVFELKDVTAEFGNGKLSVIVGATGSGKTTLIHSLLGETHLTSGTLHRARNATISYVPQAAWLLNATIRDNILFGTPMDETRYRRVIAACALERDLELLEGGDLTEVGEKGINLSGGQKQRIALARACYSKSTVIVLDDPLSAVDAPTAKHLMEKCILGLLAGRTRILVTNAAGLAIPRADDLFVLNSGRIVYQGPVEAVISELAVGAGTNDDATVGSASSSTTLTGTSAFIDGLKEMAETIIGERQKYRTESIAVEGTTTDSTTEPPKGVLVSDDVGKKLVEEETMNEGEIEKATYAIYYNASGGLKMFLALLLAYSLNQVFAVSLDISVKWWVDASAKASALFTSIYASTPVFVQTVGSALPNPSRFMFIGALMPFGLENGLHVRAEETPRQIAFKFIPLYFGLMVVYLTIVIVRLVILETAEINAGRNIHRQLIERLLYSPLRFFEVTPIGRIVNRITKDMDAVDSEVGPSVGNTAFNLLLLLFIIITIAREIPVLLVVLIPIGYIYYAVGQLFVRTCRSLKRLDSVSRSPIYSHFSETLMGLTVIRAFNDKERFFRECRKRIDMYSRIDYISQLSYTWLYVRLYFIAAVAVCIVGLLLLTAGVGKNMTGLCLTFAVQVSDMMASLVWLQSWMERTMNSMERVAEYLKLEQEAPAIVHNARPPQNWPSEGRITVSDLRFKYAPDLPEVLKGMSFETGAMEKVAVVGRTGAGKSSLALALFRIVEPCGGSILIDGVDVMRIGLEDLRSNLTIIPQDPVLFAGTIRSNLDPFESLSDTELWIALKRAHLVSSTPFDSPTVIPKKEKQPERAKVSSETVVIDDGASLDVASSASASRQHQLTLDTAVSEGGSNFSAGEKQLLCLARALARKSRVIVMDEATASVDTETDSRIQQTIREEFSDCTVITIAHRLKTIADYDRVVVLDHGSVIENGSPFELLQSSSSPFRKMCEETGEFEDLISIARARSLLAASRAA
ncbi:hypothetical protein HDU96_003875 [Phlyctochytrium bullatum]|nr:hypothetical protein HDU96_003875 [Phlyctochytrium bullatum]